jgi:hypothetical protein
MYKEIRFRALTTYKPEDAEKYLEGARKYAKERFAMYKDLSGGGAE